MKVAPALAARRAWAAEKHKVTFTIVPSSESALQTRSPSGVSGTLTVTLGAILASRRPSASIGSYWVERDLGADRAGDDPADLGHDLDEVAAALGDERRVGRHAVHQAGRGQSLMSATSAVSMKNFMAGIPRQATA